MRRKSLLLCGTALSALATALFTSGCGSAGTSRSPLTPSRKAAVTLDHADPRIGTYVSSDWGFRTASYWIEGPDGLVFIDTQFLLSAATESLDWAEAVTGKKVVMAVVLHPNPDKFNGTEVFRKRGVKVVTSEQVRHTIPSVHQKRLRSFYDRYKPDYPSEMPVPDSFGVKTIDLTAAGITFRAHVLGAGCSEAHVVVEYDGHVFPGDLVANDAHSWLEIGRSDEWLKRIEEMKRLKPNFVHPGRGPSGSGGLLDQEEAYLKRVTDLIAEEGPKMPIPEGALARVKTKVVRAFPGYDFDVFLDIGLPAEWERHAAERAHANTNTNSNPTKKDTDY